MSANRTPGGMTRPGSHKVPGSHHLSTALRHEARLGWSETRASPRPARCADVLSGSSQDTARNQDGKHTPHGWYGSVDDAPVEVDPR